MFRVPLPWLLDLGLRCAALLVLWACWEWLAWDWSVGWTIDLTVGALSPFYTAIADGSRLLCNGYPFAFGKECTYLDLFLISAPFVWRPRQGAAVNLGRQLAVLSLIVVVNQLRLFVGVAATLRGVSWESAHNLPDMLLYWPMLAGAVILYAHSLSELIGEPVEEGGRRKAVGAERKGGSSMF